LNPHLCHAKGCLRRVAPAMLMCRAHWFMVPKDLRELVWASYVPGQEIGKNPSGEYLAAAQKAIDAVAAREARK
jgi:hypothetical protein